MSDNDEELRLAALREHARGLSDDDWRLFSAQVRPPAAPAAQPAADESNLPAMRRSEARSKIDQLMQITAASGPNGFQGIAAATAAHARQAPTQPQPPAATGPQQTGPTPETERARNTRLIDQIIASRGNTP